LLRSLQEIQPDFVEEAKASAGLWGQGKMKIKMNGPFEMCSEGNVQFFWVVTP
jgi:hypothetical protein